MYIIHIHKHEHIKNNSIPSILIKRTPNLFPDSNDVFATRKHEYVETLAFHISMWIWYISISISCHFSDFRHFFPFIFGAVYWLFCSFFFFLVSYLLSKQLSFNHVSVWVGFGVMKEKSGALTFSKRWFYMKTTPTTATTTTNEWM